MALMVLMGLYFAIEFGQCRCRVRVEDLNWAFAIEFDAAIVLDGISYFPELDKIFTLLERHQASTGIHFPEARQREVLRNRERLVGIRW